MALRVLCLRTANRINNFIPAAANSSVLRTNYEPTARCFHACRVQCDLMEFFDDKKNWGENVVRVGRSWRVEELRIKSNSDLHKLWYVLLKEKNMLLTMQLAYKEECEYFPNPERIDKVEESMENLETVVRERNQAYHELEVGEYTEVPKPDRSTPFRHLFCPEIKEYPIPKHENEKWQKEKVEFTMKETQDFVKKMNAIMHSEKVKRLRRERNHVMQLYKRFPNLDEEAVKMQFPDVDLVEIKRKLE